jgi:hypothetical protein
MQPKFYNVLWTTSWLSTISSGYAIWRGHYDCACVPGAVFLTSINYWRKPDYSWRRYIDMGVTCSGFTYQLFRAYNAEYWKEYYVLAFTAAMFFPIGVHYYKHNRMWRTTYSHAMIHLIGNLANIVLYSGYINGG